MQSLLRHHMGSLRAIWVSWLLSINKLVKKINSRFPPLAFFRFFFVHNFSYFSFRVCFSDTGIKIHKNEKIDDGPATSERRQLSQVKLGEEN